MSSRGDHQTVPLSVLLRREQKSEKIENPELSYGQASQTKKGEDLTLLKTECQRNVGDGVTTFSVFALFDGHNGSAAAVYSKEHLLNNVLSAIPSDLNREDWVAALPRAMVAGFIKTDKDFLETGQASGTTVTFVILEGWSITVASVGDSRCIFESAEGDLYSLSADHRLDTNVEERERVTASGGEVGRLNTGGGTEDEQDKEPQKGDDDGPLILNAFDLIIPSQGLNLQTLFDKEQEDSVKHQTRFISQKPAKVVLSSMEVVAQSMGFKTHIRNYKMRIEGLSPNKSARICVILEVFEVAPAFFMVDIQKAAGDLNEYLNFYKNFCENLDDIIWKHPNDSGFSRINKNKSRKRP